MGTPNIGTQYILPESVFRSHLRWMLPACRALDCCMCMQEDDRPCGICLDYLKRCYIDMGRTLNMDALCPHGLSTCLDCFPKKSRKR